MDSQKTHGGAINNVNVQRISINLQSSSTHNEDVNVAVESPLVIDVEGVEHYTVLCTPIDKLAMAAGFLYSEGVIDSLDEVSRIELCEDDPGIVRVKLTGDSPKIMDPGRNLVIVSSCGACGTEEFSTKIDALPKVQNTLQIDSGIIQSAVKNISECQPVFEACGGTHVIGLFDNDGKLASSAEDTGRHNALDKVIGKCLFDKVPFAGSWAVLSGRVSLEMVGKCARAGIELIAAISAPTSLAIEVAEKCGITLCAFVRENRATVFTHPQRVKDLEI